MNSERTQGPAAGVRDGQEYGKSPDLSSVYARVGLAVHAARRSGLTRPDRLPELPNVSPDPKCASTASAPLTPTTRASSSRAARRTPATLPNAVSRALRRRGPIPPISSSSDRRSRVLRCCRWNVTAKRCASSRMRWIRRSAGLSVASAIAILAIAREEQLLLLGDPDRDERSEPELLERLVGRRELALAAVDQHEIRKRPARLEKLAVAPQDDFVHRGEVVQDHCARGSALARCGCAARGLAARGGRRRCRIGVRAQLSMHRHRRILQEAPLTPSAERRAPSADPWIRNFRYSDRFIRPSSQTTIDATVSAPWIVEMSKHSIRRGTAGSASTARRVSSAS